jgi:nickel transport protein
MKLLIRAAVLLSLFAPTAAGAHEIVHKVSRGGAVVVEVSYATGAPFSYEQYEVSLQGEATPFQTGRSDALGRIVFLPDRYGTWRIRAFSEDGHGIDITVNAGPEDVPAADAPAGAESDRWNRIVFGVLVILGLFFLVMIFLRRRA